LYKAVLIEDEIVIRENIRENFPWVENGILFAGEASDGETALQLIEDVSPQIVITDIKMPFLDGLDLSRIVLSQMPWIKVIIMTGHDDFELAQQALKIGVSDYLLKPVGMEELKTSLQSVIQRIDDEREHLDNIEKLQTEMQINKQFLQKEFLSNLIAGVLSVSEIFDTAITLDIAIKAKAYGVIVLNLEMPSPSVSEEFIKAGSIINTLQTEDVFLIRSSLKEYILLMKGASERALQNDRYRISQSIKREIERQTKVQVSLSIGGVKSRLQDIHESYEEAQKTAKLSYLFGKNKVVGFEDTRMLNPYQGARIPFERSEISDFLRMGLKDELDTFINKHIQRFEAFPSNLFFTMLTRFNVFYETTLFLEEIGYYQEVMESNQQLNQLITEYAESMSLSEVIEQTRQIFTFALQQREQQKNQTYESVINKVKNYIKSNYQHRTLQLSDVANHVNLSCSHLSTIFNQETGMSYTDYVCEVRIAKAKELLALGSLRSAEVAYAVGFSDPHYFYTIFKKVTGMTSSAYRTSAKGVDAEV
jgi:two-component system response regulator YesN